MQPDPKQYLSTIKDHKLSLPGLNHDRIAPYYDGLAISNIPDSIASWLGAPRFSYNTLHDDLHNSLAGDIEHVILVVMDGLGYNWLQRFIQEDPDYLKGVASWQKLLKNGSLYPLTSIVPSTTSAALSTLWTGATPLEHGIVGFEMWLKEYGLIANMIHQSPASYANDNGSLMKTGFDPQTFLPVPLITQQLSKKGIKTFAFQPASIIHSGLSRMLLQGAKMFPYQTQSDLWVSLLSHVEQRRHLKTYTYVYCSEIDTLAHRYGPDDDRLFLEFSNTSMMIERFIHQEQKRSNGRTLFLLVADHGQIATPKNDKYHLAHYPEFKNALIMQPSGENRFSYLYPRNGFLSKIKEQIDQNWGNDFSILSQEALLSSSLLGRGSHHPDIKNRIGDLILVSNNNNYLWWVEKENPLLGRHGGLSDEEMLVPLFALRL